MNAFEECADKIIAASDKVKVEFTKLCDESIRNGTDLAFSPALGFSNRLRELGPNGSYLPRAPIKFAYKVRNAVKMIELYLLCFEGVKKAYEIGVGCGYLMYSLKNACGIDIRGCDIQLHELGVYSALRNELGLVSLVEEQFISFEKITNSRGN